MKTDKYRNQYFKNLVGQKFGNLTVIEDTGKTWHRSVVWKCLCDCGKTRHVTTGILKVKHGHTCGDKCPFRGSRRIDLTGKRFGRLVALKYVSTPKDIIDCRFLWECQCDCGNIKTVRAEPLRKGETKSCGCLLVDSAKLRISKQVRGPKGRFGGYREVTT